MVIRVYSNNDTKTKREIEKNKKTSDFNKMKTLIIQRNDEMRYYFGSLNDNSMGYIKKYKEKNLISLKQVEIDPFNWQEKWEIKEKDLSFVLEVTRKVTSLGVEMVYVGQIQVKYRGISTILGGNMYDYLNVSEGHDQITRFFRLLTNYSNNLPIKKVKK